jgi:hypothetical protein
LAENFLRGAFDRRLIDGKAFDEPLAPPEFHRLGVSARRGGLDRAVVIVAVELDDPDYSAATKGVETIVGHAGSPDPVFFSI